jgi:uncharacterized membrane protein YgcG
MRRAPHAFVAAASLLFLLPRPAAADAPRPEARVTDAAHALAPAELAQVEERLAATKRQTDAEVGVLTVPSLVDAASVAPRPPGGGAARAPADVRIVVAPKERRLRVEAGERARGRVELRMDEIDRATDAPLREGRVRDAIVAAVDRVAAALGAPSREPAMPRRAAPRYIPLAVLAFAGVLVSLRLFGSRRRTTGGAARG